MAKTLSPAQLKTHFEKNGVLKEPEELKRLSQALQALINALVGKHEVMQSAIRFLEDHNWVDSGLSTKVVKGLPIQVTTFTWYDCEKSKLLQRHVEAVYGIIGNTGNKTLLESRLSKDGALTVKPINAY